MRHLVLLSLALVLFSTTAAAQSLEGATIDDIIEVLHERGLIDDEQRTRMLVKHRAEQESLPSVANAFLDGWHWSGDLRLRYEAFRFDSDSIGGRRQNRHRFRYRLRLGFEKTINDWLSVGARLASGPRIERRSTNQTLGDDEDFDRDEINIDRAYARFILPELGELQSELLAGKLANPFHWRHGPDFMVWDHDLSPEGTALISSYPLSESTRLLGTFGAFIVDEKALSSDPKLIAGQLGVTHTLGDGAALGLRASAYEWHSLDREFVARAQEFGNLPSAFDDSARIGDLYGFVEFEPHIDWPTLVYATWAENFSADSAVIGGFRVGQEDTAWGAGLEFGRSTKIARFGWGYYYIEANALVAQFTDSDTLDGFTNRRGWIFYATRTLADRVQLRLEWLDSDSIRNAPPFAVSSANADRKRLRTDLIIKF